MVAKAKRIEKVDIGHVVVVFLLSAIDMVVLANALEYEQKLTNALEEFCMQMRAIFLAIANGLGFVPVEVISLDDGLLHDVVNYYHLHHSSTPQNTQER